MELPIETRAPWARKTPAVRRWPVVVFSR